jgi:lipoate---protein ligase
MKCLRITLPSPEENLACDEALLDAVEAGEGDEVLRIWNVQDYFVVVGYANRVGMEVNVPYCQTRQIPILRRCSGGGAVLQGPGCLNYSLILRIPPSGPLSNITGTNRYIMSRNRDALVSLIGTDLQVQGHTDLARQGLKFSGNAQKRKLRALLFHGTFLLNLDPTMVEGTLRMPSKEPDYRGHRSHRDFLVNLPVSEAQVTNTMVNAWGAHDSLKEIPSETISRLVSEKYGQREWNLKF